MDYKPLNMKFELPKSPASTLHNDGSDDNDDNGDVEYMGTIVSPAGEQTLIGTNQNRSPNPNLATMPSLLVTPPLSPLGAQQSSMPFLTAMLSQNNSANLTQGYVVHIPCYLCKRPFSDIELLREHLTMHARQLNIHLRPGATDAPNLYTFPPTATIEPNNFNKSVQKETQQQQRVETAQVSCEDCGKHYSSKASLRAHQRQHRLPTENNKRCWSKRQYRCHICRKSYKRESFLHKHRLYKHSQQQYTHAEADPAAAEASAEQKQRCVWTTKVFNAVAAANYSPATETASKYLPPTPAASEPLNPSGRTVPKQKYALRSPYFNPNLWVDYDAYI